ncbi:hypothetical protein JR316_0012095 [Psilocybe cubensis]|uniref:Uncharacterized protein n=1 Tax=Psilocybe cubensis TaxID=181762 RepID=A0ACB8GH63_PSICU|nr:hypothetical protein JR316_0012095 [Psilocybe cubensis]KAH9474996.1 hypothetical protein JR316_0012095 [Psilocybe cubensis]
MSFIMLINFYIYVKKYLKLWLLNITYCLDSITPALAPAPSVVDSRKFPALYSHEFQADINTPPV